MNGLENEIKDAWHKYCRAAAAGKVGRHWTGRDGEPLRLALYPKMSTKDAIIGPADDAVPVAHEIRHCLITAEPGGENGIKVRRIIGRVPGTDVSVLLQTITD